MKSPIIWMLKILMAVIQTSAGILSGITKLNIDFTKSSHFPLVNERMALYFSQSDATRALIGVTSPSLPECPGMNTIIEISNEPEQ